MGLRESDVERLRAVVSEGTFDRRFEVIGESARGAMGCVFEARDRLTDTRVALKLLLGTDARARFTAEAEILERIDHPAIVKHVRHGVTDSGDLYLVMEWLQGETLGRRIQRAPLDCLEAATVGERLAGALAAAHAMDIVHRDLKPSNVFLVDGKVELATLIDFGVAKTHRDLTRTGQVVGTPGYMAPEQVRGERGIDGRVDLFALGCVLYEAVAPRPPFVGTELIEVLARGLLETPPRLDELVAGVPPRFVRLIDALLDKDPDRRLGDAIAARDELVAIRTAIAEGNTSALASQRVGDPLGAEPRRMVGRYVLRELLGTGGMGVVFAAEDPELGRPVAVKLLRPDLARGESGARMEQRLRREAQALAQLAHPNVVAVHDVGVHENRIFVAMEHVQGQTLARWLAAAPRGRREILDTFLAAGRGLAAAHAAGLVHRDFKPENVLVGNDGRVRVVDFGLVRNSDEQAEQAHGSDPGSLLEPAAGTGSVSPEAPTALAGLTALGVAMGTPYYMAPEQYRGERVDANSDQFSFCVALHGALYGERPFAGDSIEELSVSVCAGNVIAPRRRRGVGRRTRLAIRRGLATRPDQRFPTMDALLAALAPRARRGWWMAAAAGSAALVTVLLVMTLRSDAPAPCGDAEQHLRGVWDPSRKLAVAVAIFATRVPYADATWREVTRRLDDYAGDWQAMHRRACEATRISGEQTEDVLELRMACLDERLHGLEGLVSTLAAPDRTIAQRATTAAQELPSIAHCADVVALTSPVRPPDPAAKLRVDALRGELATLRARRNAGIYDPTLETAKLTLEHARTLGYRPLEAEALALVGQLERDREGFAASRTAYEQSILAADAGRDDRQAASSLIELIAIVGRGLGKVDEVPALRDRARALLERIDHPPELSARLLEVSGLVELDAGQIAEAERDLRAAIAVWERLHGRDDLHVVNGLRSLARIELERERAREARVLLERALAIQRRVLGDRHPDLATTLSMIGGADYAMGRFDDATARYEQARTIYADAVGPESAAVANVLDNLASVYAAQNKIDEAIELHRRAIAIAAQRLGARHPTTLVYQAVLAASLAGTGRGAEAIALLEEVLASQRAQLGPQHQSIAMTLEILANVELAVGRHAAARDHAREAMTMFEHVLGTAYNPYAELRALGEAELGLGEAGKACDALEQARRHLTDTTDPGNVAWLDGMLGRALIDSGRSRARGLELLASAWPRIAADERLVEQREELAAWMMRRGIPVPR